MLHDKQLEKLLNKQIDNLERKIDWIGPTPLRHKMSEQAVGMRLTLRDFDQNAYEGAQVEPQLIKFTVILLRPDYMCSDVPYGQDTYVAHVEAKNWDKAIKAAQQEVFDADTQDDLGPLEPTDYALCVMFDGFINPCFFGWQT